MAHRGRIPLLLVSLAWVVCERAHVAAEAVDAAASTPSATAADFTGIDSHVASEMRRARVPGLALAIVHRDRVVHLRGFGVAGPDGRPVTPETPFAIASVSKSFTALAIMQQVEAGRLELDAPATRYLPWFRTADADASARITVRRLLSHTSGLPTRAGLRDRGSASWEQSARDLDGARLSSPPGARFEYSNANYLLLGLILHAVAGQEYEAYVQQHIFEPLEMRRSFVSLGNACDHGLAAGHRYWFGIPEPLERQSRDWATLPAGGLFSCAADLARYLVAHMNHGRYGSVSVLSRAGMAEMHSPQPSAAYGLGWFVTDWDGPRTIWHGGGGPGFTAMITYQPSSEWGVVTLMNGWSYLGNVRRYEIGPGVLKLLSGGRPRPIETDTMTGASYAALALVVGLLTAGVVRSVVRAWRPRADAESVARARRFAFAHHSAVPLLLGAGWAYVLLSAPALLSGASLRLTLLAQPDLALLLLLSAGLGLAWGVLVCALRLRRMKRDA